MRQISGQRRTLVQKNSVKMERMREDNGFQVVIADCGSRQISACVCVMRQYTYREQVDQDEVFHTKLACNFGNDTA